MELPAELNKEYNLIQEEFKKMERNYHPNIDAFITEDKVFTKRVINFQIRIIDYILDNYNKINLREYQEFLGYYDLHFCYGPNGDDMNYFDSDDNSLNGEPFKEFCWELMDQDYKISKAKLKEIKSKYVAVLSRF